MRIAFVSVLLLAGQGQSPSYHSLLYIDVITALSLSIDVGGSVGTIDATQFLNVTDTYLLTDVRHTIRSLVFPSNPPYISVRPNAPTQTLKSLYVPLLPIPSLSNLPQTCAANNSCLCASNAVTAITSCEQCMFSDLIAKFKTSTDPRAGSTAALTGTFSLFLSLPFIDHFHQHMPPRAHPQASQFLPPSLLCPSLPIGTVLSEFPWARRPLS
jgi:hypothetical protein